MGGRERSALCALISGRMEYNYKIVIQDREELLRVVKYINS